MQQTRMNQPRIFSGGWVSRVIASSFPPAMLKESRCVIGATKTRDSTWPYLIRADILCVVCALLMLMLVRTVNTKKRKFPPSILLVDVWCGSTGVFHSNQNRGNEPPLDNTMHNF